MRMIKDVKMSPVCQHFSFVLFCISVNTSCLTYTGSLRLGNVRPGFLLFKRPLRKLCNRYEWNVFQRIFFLTER